MCPTRAADDLWDDTDDAPDGQQELQREWEARRQQYYNTGYREGLDAGKADTIQQGFNAGFAQGAQSGYAYGQLKGALQSLAVMGSPSIQQQARELLQQLSAVPVKHAAADICAALLQRPLQEDEGALAGLTAAMQQLLTAGPAATTGSDVPRAAAGQLALQLQQHLQQQLAALGHTLPPPPAVTKAAAKPAAGEEVAAAEPAAEPAAAGGSLSGGASGGSAPSTTTV